MSKAAGSAPISLKELLDADVRRKCPSQKAAQAPLLVGLVE